MTIQTVVAELLGANPGPAAHIALLGIVVVVALAVFAFVRQRNKRDAAEAMHSATLDDPPSPPSTQAHDRDPSTSTRHEDR